MKRSRTLLVALLVVGVLASVFLWRQVFAANSLWSSAGGSAWLTAGNWGSGVPGSADIGQFGVNPTAATNSVGINMNGSTNNGANNQAVGAIEILNTRSNALQAGNSSTTASGTLTLNGTTVNSVSNTIIRNNSAGLLTVQANQGSGLAMGLALGNATDNIINIDSTGGVTISSIISGSSRKLTLGGAGTGALTLSGANTYSGGTTVGTGLLRVGVSSTVGGGVVTNGPIGTGTWTLATGATVSSDSATARTINNNLSLSGNFTLGNATNTGALTFDNSALTTKSTALTADTTLTTNSSVTIVNSISGSFKLTKEGTSTLTASGTNIYTGDTTINNGTFSLGTAGLISLSANIVLAGGSTFDLSAHSSAISMSSGQGLKGTGTSSTGTITLTGTGTRLQTATNSPLQFTAFSGTTPPLTVAGSTAASLTLNENNPVTVNTTVALGAGDYPLIAKSGSANVAIVSGIPPTSLTIGGSGLASGAVASLLLTSGQLILHVVQPTITVTGGPLNFGSVVSGATSIEKTYTVAGSNLTANLIVTSPNTDFQVSLTSGSGFGASVSLTPSSGTVVTTTIYVRFTPGSTGSKGGNTTNASTGATTQNVSVSGTGISSGTFGGKIAFTSNRDGNNEIYIMNADGSNQTRLTSNAADDSQPCLNPDGTKITFTSDRDGNDEIYFMFADGTSQNRLTNNAAIDYFPCFNPDSSKITFTSNRDGNEEIYLMDSNGLNQTRLTNNAAVDRDSASSPGGGQIAFRSDRLDGDGDIYSMNSDGTNQTQLTTDGAGDLFPAWSPTSSQIAFRSDRLDLDGDIFSMNSNGSSQTQLTTDGATDTAPGYSPDGAKIAFQTNRDGNHEIYVMNSNGTSQTRLTNNSAGDFEPSWGVGNVTPGSLQFSSATYSTSETALTVAINVTRTGGSEGNVSVSYATSAGTATPGASCGGVTTDYVDTSGSLTFLAGETSKSFNITVCNDIAYEPDDTVNLAVSSPLGGATLGSPSSAVLTITSEDAAPTVGVAPVTMNEGDVGTTSFNFNVFRTGSPSQDPITVNYHTVDGSAVAPGDYTAVTSSGMIPAFGASFNATVLVNGDTTFESNETFTMHLDSTTIGTIAQNDQLGTITNDDAAPDVVFNSSGNLAAGTYNNVTINNCGTFVTMTGNVTVNGTLTINACAHLLTETFIVSGPGSLVLNADGWLHIGDPNGITTSPTLSGNIQLTGTRSYSTAANYQYTGNVNQAVGNGLPGTVANLLIVNSGPNGNNTLTGNTGQIVTVLLEVIDGIYVSASDYNDVIIDVNGTLSLAANITVSGNWTNNDGTFTPNGFRVTFDGTGTQTITRPAGETFATVTVNKASGNAHFLGAVHINGTGPNVLELLNGGLDLTSGQLNFDNNGGTVLVSGGVRTITATSTSVVAFQGVKTVTATAGGTLVFDTNINVSVAAAVDFGASLSTINGELIITTIGQVVGNAPTYGASSTLHYTNVGGRNRDLEWTSTTASSFPSPGYPNNVTIDTTSTLLVGNVGGTTTNWAINGTLTCGSGGTFSLAGGSPMTVPVTIKDNVDIATGGTLLLSSAAGGDLNVGGNWTKTGTFTSNGRTVTFNGTANQSIGGTSPSAFGTLAISNPGNTVTLNQNASDTALNVTSGTFSQAGTSDLTSGAVTVSSGATWSNLAQGDLTLSGNVSNAGTITFNANGTGCGDADSILIRSSALVQRNWAGTGSFNMTDVDVSYQRTPLVPPPVAIVVTSGTDSGNNTGWAFSGTCTAGTYTWVGGINADWQVPTNWSPTRAVPAAGDILYFDGNATPGPIVTNVPTQTIAALRLINSVAVTLNASAVTPPHTLTVSGATGMDLTIPALSQLTLAGTDGLTINVASGSTATIGGLFLMQDGPHRLIGNAANAITFQSGSICTTAPSYSSSVNPFGMGGGGANGTTGSVIFQSGANYFHNNGASPFGALVNPAVVVFQTGSLATFLTAIGFEGSGRTYANLAIGKVDPGGVEVDAADSGAGNFQFDNLTVNSTGTADSSLTFTGSGANTITIRGRIDSNGVGIGGTLPDVIFTAGSGGIVLDQINGIVFATDVTNARSVDFESSATVTAGTELLLDRKLLMGFSQPSSVVLTINGVLNGSVDGYVIGKVRRPFPSPESFIYHVGTPNGYAPVDVNVTSIEEVGDSLTVLARQGAQPDLTSATSLQRYWNLTEAGAIIADLTFHYNQTDVMGSEPNYRLVIVEAGNATQFPENCPTVACVDETANTIKKNGVDTFSDWTAGEPNAPTAVKLTGFTAVRSGDEVMLRWQSGYEASNLGYNIYREQNGKRVQITPSLVAGSALIAGRQTQLTAGLNYTWYDKTGAGGRRQEAGVSDSGTQDSALSTQNSSATYWLEDVDLNGIRTLHGPIAVSECGGGDCKRLSERSRLFGELTPQSAIRSLKSGSGVEFNGGPTTTAGPDSDIIGTGDDGDSIEMQRTIAGMTALKISVSQAGWYRISQPEAAAAGFTVVDAKHLQLYRNGRQVPFSLSNTADQFGPTDYLEFYGEGLSSTTDKAQTYYLIDAEEAGKRIRGDKATQWGDPEGPQSFAYTVERKERMIYFSGLLNGEAENFFGQVVNSTATNAALPVSHIDSASQTANVPSQLEVVLQGVSSQSHLVQVRINGTDLGTMSFANTEHPNQTFSVPAAAIHDGNNTVELTALGGATDVSLVDALRLTYVREFAADNNTLTFSVNSQQTKRVTGFSNEKVRVVDVTDPYNPVELVPVISPDGGGFMADVQARASLNRPHTLVAFAERPPTVADALRLNEPSSWWSETAGADYVIITTAELKPSVQTLAQLRTNQGMVVHTVDVEDLYDEFSFGKHTPQALRDFLQRAVTSWTRQPHYVLFAGDASYDPKNYAGLGLNDLVPTRLIDTALAETASDDWLADFNGDGIADLALGRLPVRTVAETSALVGKIVNYENATPDPSRGAVLVADNGFEAPSSVVQGLLPSGMTVQTINRNSADDATIHNQIITGLNQGPLVTNYIGHGSNGVWTGASLLSSLDAPSLTNTNRLTVFTMMTCFNGYFQDAYNESLSEALLKSQGGAVAVWASTTLTDPAGQNAIDQEFYRLLLGAQPQTLGDAARAAKVVTTDADVRRTWTLLGDPAMRLR